MMAKILSYPLTIIYQLLFGLVLVVFHPIQWICHTLFGYQAHKKSVSLLNLFLMRTTHLIGTTYDFRNPWQIPDNVPLIIVANHQSMYDIPPIIWYMRKHHPKFVSKKELGKGIPSVSYNLRHGGSALIDRKDRKQSLSAIAALGDYIETTKRSAVIFPEGTRSRDGKPKEFRTFGLKILMEHAPSALVVPISINNSWKMLKYGKFPHGLGARITFDIHRPIPPEERKDNVLSEIEATIKNGILPQT